MSALTLTDRPARSRLQNRSTPMRAVILGCGTVGGGVAASLPPGIRLEGVLVRTPRADLPRGVPVFTAPDAILSLRPDLVIEALPGGNTAEVALERAVSEGCHVITANKDVAARRPDLAVRSHARGRVFACSAAVGGGVPVLETIGRLRQSGAKLERVRGVLNGTSNFVLDRLAAGESLEVAVAAAQAAGFAEADPGADLDGLDAANKLILIARAAWGLDLSAADISRQSIRDLLPTRAVLAARNGQRLRQVARLGLEGGSVHAAVRLETLDLDDPLARTRNEGNCVVLTPHDGTPVILSGKGAGRSPTAASMLGDIHRLVRETTW